MTRALLYCIIDERLNNKVHRQALFVLASQNFWTQFLMYFHYLSLSPLIFLKNLPQNSNRPVPMILDRIQEDSQEGREEWPSHKFMNHFGSPYLLTTPHCLWKFSQSLYRSTKYSRNFQLRKASTPQNIYTYPLTTRAVNCCEI